MSCLHSLVDDWDFNEAQLREFTGPALQLLAAMLHGMEDFESQLQVGGHVRLVFPQALSWKV